MTYSNGSLRPHAFEIHFFFKLTCDKSFDTFDLSSISKMSKNYTKDVNKINNLKFFCNNEGLDVPLHYVSLIDLCYN